MTRFFPRGTVAASLALAAFALAGCSHDDTPAPQVNTTTNVTPTPSGTSATTTTTATTPGGTTSAMSTNNTNAGAGGATGTNAGVADSLNKAIRTNTQMTGSRITAVVNAAGEARLTGTAQNAQQKALAESTARQTAGVNHVVNKVEIVPTGGAKSAAAPAKTKVIIMQTGQTAAPAPGTSSPAPGTSSPADTSNATGTAAPSGTTAPADTTTGTSPTPGTNSATGTGTGSNP